MTDKEKADFLLDAMKDISMALASLACQGTQTKDEALRLFEDTFVVIAGIAEESHKRVTLQ